MRTRSTSALRGPNINNFPGPQLPDLGDPSQVSFTPAQDWPADKQFRIVFDPELFPSHVRMEKLEYDASTPPFRADLKDVTLSEDAKEPGVQRVLATIELLIPKRASMIVSRTCCGAVTAAKMK